MNNIKLISYHADKLIARAQMMKIEAIDKDWPEASKHLIILRDDVDMLEIEFFGKDE